MTVAETLTTNLIGAFPKIELHVHAEAFLSPQRIEQLAAMASVPMMRPAHCFYEYDSLAEFLQLYEWWCDLLRTPEITEQLGYDIAVRMSGDGIIYAELYTSPRYWRRLSYQQVVTSLGDGMERAFADGYADCRLIPAISREQPAEWAMELLDWIGSESPRRVVGIGLEGNERAAGRTSPRFENAYERAAEFGLGRTAHAGESSGPEGVWDALNYLQVDRVDHGVRAIEDPDLVQRLVDDEVTLNVCPTSNILTGLYRSLPEHPIGALIDAGVPVTVNSDDPEPMSVSLTGEIVGVGREFGWALSDVASATRRAIDASFCDEDCALELHRKVDEFLATV